VKWAGFAGLVGSVGWLDVIVGGGCWVWSEAKQKLFHGAGSTNGNLVCTCGGYNESRVAKPSP
jgi:hypothetical protein